MERARPGLPLARYVKAALRQAICQQSADNYPYEGAIAALPDLHAHAAAQDTCRSELRDALEMWLLLRLGQGLPSPPIDAMPVPGWVWLTRGL